MTRISDFVPSPAVALDLPIDDLALRLLAFNAAAEDAGGSASRNPCVKAAHWGEYEPMGEHRDPFMRTLTEAWDWLVVHRLVSSTNPSQSHDKDSAFVTRRGRAVLDNEQGLAR